jgi:DNA-directed RNA polymerase specialized sigma24 family protein
LERHRAWELADPVEPLIQHMATGFALEMTRQARAESRDAGVTVPLDDHDAAQTDVAETRARILEALARLPEAQRQVVSLLLAGHGQADAGAACGVSRDAAYRAQVALDAIFEADEI